MSNVVRRSCLVVLLVSFSVPTLACVGDVDGAPDLGSSTSRSVESSRSPELQNDPQIVRGSGGGDDAREGRDLLPSGVQPLAQEAPNLDSLQVSTTRERGPLAAVGPAVKETLEAAPASVRVVVDEAGMHPSSLEIPPGTIVEFDLGDAPRTVKSGTGCVEDSLFSGTGSFRARFDGPGVYPYFVAEHCVEAIGTITVR